MFGFGKKKRAADAIGRGAQATLTGAYLHYTEIELLGLNESASAWILTESYAHHIYALGYVSSHVFRNEKWATMDFFVDSAIAGMVKSEAAGGTSTERLAPIIFKRYGIFDALTGEQRLAEEHYKDSARLVKDQDPNANFEEIARMLKISTNKYVDDIRKIFSI